MQFVAIAINVGLLGRSPGIFSDRKHDLKRLGPEVCELDPHLPEIEPLT